MGKEKNSSKDSTVTKEYIEIIGGGLAGCEAAWQAAKRKIPVVMYEMRPHRFSPAHHTENLAELVCSNSFRSDAVDSAVGLLKEEMRCFDSLMMKVAEETSVPAGKALAVDREKFAARVSELIEQNEYISVKRQEIEAIPELGDNPVILATGPLSSEKVTASLMEITGEQNLAFYDAIAPIIDAASLNMDIIYRKSRWEDENPGDYLNCPMTKDEYFHFIDLLQGSQTVPLKSFEEPKYFEGCLPIEVMLERGEQTLLFGPMKPVGLADPNGNVPFAVVQLRAENRAETSYNMVGFQTKLTYGAQEKVFRAIPGLEDAEFLRLGSIHRNTFICAPELLLPTLQMKKRPNLFLAGQLSGVEGYVESAAMGLIAGINAARMVGGKELIVPPPETAHGALLQHLTATEPKRFQPSNINFGLFPPLGKKIRKKERGQYRMTLSLATLQSWLVDTGM